MSKLAVVAIGGNSLIKDEAHKTVPDQFDAVRETATHIAEMIAQGWNVVITHGNGPQVGFILLRSELSRRVLHPVPLDSCGADTQGAIGYMIQQALHNEFLRRGIARQCVTVVTQVRVDSDDPALHTLSTLGNTLRRDLDGRLYKWKQAGQFGFLFDNAEDTVSFSRFQCFDFQGMREYPQVLEPLLFYVLHRADAIIRDPKISHVFKAFFIDEAWVFLKNPSIRSYIVEALKTWRKHNAALVLSTQSLDELLFDAGP